MTSADKLLFSVTLGAVLGCGLMAGIFFAFSAFVMQALAAIPPAKGIAAMQSINAVIQNPLFFTVFFGTAAASVFCINASRVHWHEPGAGYLLAGGLLYLVGSFLVTVVFNVPLNDALASVNPDTQDAAAVWSGYLTSWTAWNNVRTVATLAATASFALALYYRR